jgi:hypothetical protein
MFHFFSGAIPFNRNYQLNSNNPNPRFRRRLANEEEEKYSNQQVNKKSKKAIPTRSDFIQLSVRECTKIRKFVKEL